MSYTMLNTYFSYLFYLTLITILGAGVLPLYRVGVGISHFYKWKKLQLREVRSLAQGHTASKWASQKSNPNVSSDKALNDCTLYLQVLGWSANVCRLTSAPHCPTSAFPSALPHLNNHHQFFVGGGPKIHIVERSRVTLPVGCTNQLVSILCTWAKT